ncbi:SGNH hydrolase domain-containing protein [Nocardioides hungaricus]
MPPDHRRGFRDDIQGMRALAVLGILLFHAGLAPYSGGFVTLDVFFVLSGFLITTLLLREVAQSGTIDLVAFYVRRARRILPAATVAIAGTVLAAWLWLPLIDARDTAVDGVWAALFGANVRFALDQTDYFTQTDPASPLQHFWSLSVEEQFYLVMPALLLVAVVLARRLLRRRGGPTAGIVVALGIVTVASFAWSVHASTASPESAYFSTFTRTWEFGAGALFAVVAPRLARPLTPLARNLVVLGGLGLIAVALFTVSSSDPYPGWRALAPVLGTCAVLLGGTDGPATFMQRVLGVTPLRVIGDASYSLYLWHWPVLVIAQQRVGRDLRPAELAVVLAVTALMTWASYRFVETPFRRRRSVKRPRGMLFYPAAVSVAVASCLAVVAVIDRQLVGDDPGISVSDYAQRPDGSKLSKDPAVALVEASVRAALEGRGVPRELRPALTEVRDDRADLGKCEYDDTPKRLCLRGDPEGTKTLVLIGNSHGRHWIPALDKIAEQAGWRAYYLVKSQCSAARVDLVLPGDEKPWEECREFNAWAQQQVEQLKPDLVVVSTTGAPGVLVDGEVDRSADGVAAEMGAGFRRLFADLAPLTRRLLLLADVPRRDNVPHQCLSRPGADLGTCLSGIRARATAINAEGAQAARDAGVEVVPTRQWFCVDGQCPAVIGDYVPMRDEGHVTTAYARSLAGPLGRALGLLPKR